MIATLIVVVTVTIAAWCCLKHRSIEAEERSKRSRRIREELMGHNEHHE